MSDPVLSRVQRNQIFAMIGQLALEPGDFQWSNDGGTGEKFTEILSHTPTNGRITFQAYHAGFWVRWWPTRGQSVRYDRANRWHDAISYVDDWLTAVHADYLAPDLWREIAKEQAISGAADRTEYEHPFSDAELQQLETGLADIEHYIIATQPLDGAGKQAVHNHFTYLLDAAKRGVRKIDWLNIFIGQMVRMVLTKLLDPHVYGAVMAHAATALNAVYQFGLRFLG